VSAPDTTHEWRILCLNGGSSSLKLALWRVGKDEVRVGVGAVENIARGGGRLWLRDSTGEQVAEQSADFQDPQMAAEALLAALAAQAWSAFDAVGHRLVHGGAQHVGPARVDDALMVELRALVPFAPLHLPAELSLVEALRERAPHVPQVVCFDTAFHRRLPAVAQLLPLPRELRDAGIQRYGFHGLSYESIVHTLGADGRGRTVIAHLGSGASLVALQDGQPLDTTMGFTPSGGIVMGTRTGDLDPGVVVHLLRAHGYDADRLEQLIDHDAGLRGVSETSADMAQLLAKRGDDTRAAAAVALFCMQLKKQIGAYAALLGGLDTLVFTGGIGEHASAVRAEACEGLSFLGIELDDAHNRASAAVISRTSSRCMVRVIATDEERMIARHTAASIGAQDAPP
jgi:acetate kinase